MRSLLFCGSRGSKLYLTIVGTPQWGPHQEGMRFAATSHTEMAMCLAMLWMALSLAA
jgi:hypothetical protein